MLDETITFRAKNGRSIHIRPLEQSDASFLVSIFEHMSSDSRYQRFHQPMDNPDPRRVLQEAEGIVAVIPDDSFGFIAFSDDIPVAAARYIIFGEGQAEAAVSVRDDYQNNGIGARLIELLVYEAQRRGIRQLRATIQIQNKAARRILEKVAFPQEQQLDGSMVEILFDLTNNSQE